MKRKSKWLLAKPLSEALGRDQPDKLENEARTEVGHRIRLVRVISRIKNFQNNARRTLCGGTSGMVHAFSKLTTPRFGT